MNWCDERYVKLYVRKTATWLLWPWEARCVFPLLLKEADGAGLIEVGSRDPVRTLAVMIGVPVEVVQPAVDAMLDSGTVEVTERGYLVSKFIEAQEAVKTDHRRKQDQRERQRAQARETTTAAVTRGHAASRDVTPCPPPAVAQPSCSPAQPSSAVAQPSPAQPNNNYDQGRPKKPRKARPAKTQTQAELPGDVVPEKPPREKTTVERLHDYFLEAREARLEDELGLRPAPPDEPPNWPRAAATAQTWLKLLPDEPEPRYQELHAKAIIDAYLRDPYWAGAKDRETGAPQPYPWQALCSEKVWRKHHEAVLADHSKPAEGVH